MSRKRRVDLEIDNRRRHNHGAGKVPDNCNMVGLDSIRRHHDEYSCDNTQMEDEGEPVKRREGAVDRANNRRNKYNEQCELFQSKSATQVGSKGEDKAAYR